MSATKDYWRGRHVVYRLFDRAGRVIYIGSSKNLPKRLLDHRSEAWWYELVARVKVQVFPAAPAAAAAEALAIQEEQPAFNERHTGRPPRNFEHWTLNDFRVCKEWQEIHGRRSYLPQTSRPRLVWTA